MKILFLADEESKMYWEYFKKEDFKGIDIIVSFFKTSTIGVVIFVGFCRIMLSVVAALPMQILATSPMISAFSRDIFCIILSSI